WWVGMKNTELQLLIHGQDISKAQFKISEKDVTLVKVNVAESPNYVFLDLMISSDALAQVINIEYKMPSSKNQKIKYELRVREKDINATVDRSDAIYLITPDRFVNGNPDNDTVDGMKESANREFHGGRHGGDLEGVLSKLDYLQNLGVTTLWLNPVVENDMPEYSYHGYAITDFYRVDPRYGTNEMFRELTVQLHKRGMKNVMDMIFNHCGLSHWWMADYPFKNWIHDFDEYEQTNYSISSYSDPYRSTADLDKMEKGWFVTSMPGMNHDNAFMVTYLIQNSIWWIEYALLDGIRMDTYPYNNPKVMRLWADRIYQEYPAFYLLGETWISDVSLESYWAPKNEDSKEFQSGVSSITDFPLCYAMHNAFKEDGDIKKLYELLCQDFLYDKPFVNLIFNDNHDMDRFYHIIGNNVDRFNLAMTFMLTTRGIPQIYYGSEILMENFGEHGALREDFPGGWPSDKIDAFDFDQLSADQKKAFLHLQNLLNLRKSSPVLQEGTLKHFVPVNNIYVYGRELNGEKVAVFLNNKDVDQTIDLTRFHEILNGFTLGKDLLSNSTFDLTQKLKLEPRQGIVLQLSEVNN
ncbi:MAG: glycosidase, partial [Cyclobacteriaceae bacterium]